MQAFIAVFIGGGLGSVARFAISKWLGTTAGGFPTGTLTANIIACIIVGLVWGLIAQKFEMSDNTKQLLLVGFCGGFSTFSTFSHETLQLVQGQKIAMASLYVVASIVLCLVSVFAGNQLARVF